MIDVAKYIASTPTLYGKDAEAFLEAMNSIKYSESKEKLLIEADETYKKYINGVARV